jgi:hypothetical protein
MLRLAEQGPQRHAVGLALPFALGDALPSEQPDGLGGFGLIELRAFVDANAVEQGEVGFGIRDALALALAAPEVAIQRLLLVEIVAHFRVCGQPEHGGLGGSNNLNREAVDGFAGGRLDFGKFSVHGSPLIEVGGGGLSDAPARNDELNNEGGQWSVFEWRRRAHFRGNPAPARHLNGMATTRSSGMAPDGGAVWK